MPLATAATRARRLPRTGLLSGREQSHSATGAPPGLNFPSRSHIHGPRCILKGDRSDNRLPVSASLPGPSQASGPTIQASLSRARHRHAPRPAWKTVSVALGLFREQVTWSYHAAWRVLWNNSAIWCTHTTTSSQPFSRGPPIPSWGVSSGEARGNTRETAHDGRRGVNFLCNKNRLSAAQLFL